MSCIKELNLFTVQALYKTRMKGDFPPSELRPYSSIKTLSENGSYLSFGYMQCGELLAYAYFAHVPGSEVALLDYFAVSEKCRGKGIGGKFIDRFNEFLCPYGIKNVVLEVESVEKAENEEDKTTRQRRVDFYLNRQCSVTGVKTFLFDVDYSLLQLPLEKSNPLSDDEVRKHIRQIYSVIIPPVLGPGEAWEEKGIVY